MKDILIKCLFELIKFSWRIHWSFVASGFYSRRFKPDKRLPVLLFGTDPIINNKYWANALKKEGYQATSMMKMFYNINKRGDFDLYFEDIIENSNFIFKYIHTEYIILNYILKKFDILHLPFNGLGLNDTWIKKNEINLLKKFGCKIIILPYGGDFYQYSKIPDISLRHVLQINYPSAALREEKITEQIKKFTKHADVIVSGFQTDGLGRWDVFPYNIVAIDTNLFGSGEKKYNTCNGKNGVVKVVHSPNHRFIKGTEYIIEAVNELINEGLNIELILLEKRPNDEVLKILNKDADILIEQLVLGYALSAMEAMACGVPVISNLSNEQYTRAFRRYSYLNECPILSADPENVKEKLRILVNNPLLRQQLGEASKKYVSKYHSYKTIGYTFKNIYCKIWFGEDNDLLNMFHPLNPHSYNNQSPKIEHPLVENKIPADLLEKLNK